MRAEMTSLFIGTNDVTPPSVLSLQFEVLPPLMSLYQVDLEDLDLVKLHKYVLE